MKYTPPLGSIDPNAAYVTGNQSAGIKGSLVAGPALEEPQREIMAVIAAAGLAPSDADLTQLLQGIQYQVRNVFSGASFMHFGTDTSATANVITAAVNPVVTGYIAGMVFMVKIANANTSATTANFGGGTVAVKRIDGSALQVGDLVVGEEAIFVYDGTNMQLLDYVPVSQAKRSLTLFQSSALSLPNSAETFISFPAPAAGADPRGFYNGASPTLFSIPAGIFQVKVSAVVSFAVNNVGYRQIRILQNGGAITTGGRFEEKLPVGAANTPLQITGVYIPCSFGDNFSVGALQNSGGALNTDATQTLFNIEW